MWIMLTTKLMTRPSPPKLSIHWSIPWPNKKIATKQFKMTGLKKRTRGPITNPLEFDKGQRVYHSPVWGMKEPHWVGARKIHYGNKDIRVFPHELSILTPERMYSYISESHEFVGGTAAGDKLVYDVTDGDLRGIHDAALLDGCNDRQSVQMALGIDVSNGYLYPDPLGWYRVQEEYGLLFCDEHELLEHTG